jgi:hypothetical protein
MPDCSHGADNQMSRAVPFRAFLAVPTIWAPKCYRNQWETKMTRYEVEMSLNGNKSVLGYTARKTRSVLLSYSQINGKEIGNNLTQDEIDDEWIYKHGRVYFAPNVWVGFSGRTSHEVFGR